VVFIIQYLVRFDAKKQVENGYTRIDMYLEMTKNIISIPINAKKFNLSFRELLEDSNYDALNPIDRITLMEALRADEDKVADWIGWSADKRVSSGWFFIENSGRYAVGYLSRENEQRLQDIFDDKYEACADFILKEICESLFF
jgi:hypothetical protein